MKKDIHARRRFSEDAAEFTVMISMKTPDGQFGSVGYADKDTDIDYEEGIYGYDSNVRSNVHPMTRADATKLASEIVENAPAGDVLVGVVPYSTIPNEGGFDAQPDTGADAESEDFAEDEPMDDESSDEPAEDEGEEPAEEDEGEDEGEEEPKLEARERFLKRVKNIRG